MYILKNAWRNVIRSKGRSILIGVIILAIALSSCLALSIRAAAEQTRKSALEAMNITAAISVNRTALMQQADGEEAAAPDRQKALQNIPELTLEELETYAQAESVKDFTYEKTLSMDDGKRLCRPWVPPIPRMGKRIRPVCPVAVDFSRREAAILL